MAQADPHDQQQQSPYQQQGPHQQQGPQQQGPQQETPQTKPPADRNDPNDKNAQYQLDTAVAKKQSDLYEQDKGVVEQRYKALKAAQDGYAAARKEQAAAWEELVRKRDRIKAALDCKLGESRRTELEHCWSKNTSDTLPPEQQEKCDTPDTAYCAGLPRDVEQLGQRIGEITDRAAAAKRCVTFADATYDRLVKLPAELAGAIKKLTGRAVELEQAVCAQSGSDDERNYVLYLQLSDDIDQLDADRAEPTAYGLKLRYWFAKLIDWREVSFCLQTTIFRYETWQRLRTEALKARRDNLVAVVLEECRHEPDDTGGDPGQSPPEPTPQQPCGSSTGGGYRASNQA
ncbi:hypothetical protein [Actinoplanes sp. NPDC023714]|uniref:hypothetical protein n=1 Tax=Actinoplanes sp. NPDC023714 TaxID=3154322 RepID=UPI0033D89FB4